MSDKKKKIDKKKKMNKKTKPLKIIKIKTQTLFGKKS